MPNRFRNAIVLVASYAAFTRASTVFAHDGHGLDGSHWHATDVLGFVAAGCVAALAIWLANRGK
ncbi:MAG: hypothetical protein HYX43_00145 [Burkholderiales bacterium]|nr:hypothetical protein [Burkholderiales bacterium]